MKIKIKLAKKLMKIKEVEELIENIKDSDAYKLLEEGINHIDEEVQKFMTK